MEKTERKQKEQAAPNSVPHGKPADANAVKSSVNVLGVDLNPKTARQAVVLSEIIGKPVSMRSRRKW